jgi:hypothetical protein
VFGPESQTARRIFDHAKRIRRPLTDALGEPPPPYLNPDRSLMVVWSAKSASSLTFIWYLSTVGLLDDFRGPTRRSAPNPEASPCKCRWPAGHRIGKMFTES